jgi:hypothetical protein
MKASPLYWMCSLVLFALFTTTMLFVESWIGVFIGLILTAAAGGELAIQNAKWRLLHSQSKPDLRTYKDV